MAYAKMAGSKSTGQIRAFINKRRGSIYGMMMGDGYVCARGSSSYFGINHGVDQKGYLFYKYELLKEVCMAKPVLHGDKRGERFRSWHFHTTCDVEWQKIWSIFHQDSPRVVRYGRTFYRKVVTPHILNTLDNRGVAIWLCDDGYLARFKNGGMDFRVATCEFTEQHHELMLRWFRDTYGAIGRLWINQNRDANGEVRKYRYLAFGRLQFAKIAEKVIRYVPDSMKHKFYIQVQGGL